MGPTITPLERTRRFWRAHGRSKEQLTLLHAFGNNPTTAWTAEGLSIWYGLRVDRVRRVVRDFERCGIVRRGGADGETYRWNDAQDWAIPHDPAALRVVRDRWLAEGGADLRS